jgi:O-antigen ligase
METVVRSRSLALHFAAAMGGAVFALIVAQALTLEPRYVIAFIVGILLLSLSFSVFRSLPDLLMYVLAFNLSFTSIEKTFFVTQDSTFVISGVPVGLADICMIGLYLIWAGRIFIARTEQFPKPAMLDWWVLAFWLAHALSMFQASSRVLVLLEVIRLGKYALLYFYLRHNLRRRHLKWIMAGLLFTVLVQSSLALVQYRSGSLLGIGRTKGAGDLNYEQYTVTGFENTSRAEGTTFDSHALGLLFGMALPIPLALALTQGLRPRYRLVAGTVFILGVPGLVLCFARAGWAAFAGAAAVLLFCLARGQYRGQLKSLLPAASIAIVVTGILLLPFAAKVQQRLFEAPPELVTARVETAGMAIEMWQDRPWLGCGANNYMHTLELEFSVFEGDPYFIPVHNMIIFVLTELGVIGLAVFLCLCAAVFLTAWRVARCADPLFQGIGGALLGGLAALMIEGLFDPIYATTVTYFMLWFQLGVAAAVYEMIRSSSRKETCRTSA